MDPAAEAAAYVLPAASANPTMRSATSSGCSTTLVECVTTPGRMTFPSGSFTSRQTFQYYGHAPRAEPVLEAPAGSVARAVATRSRIVSDRPCFPGETLPRL